MSSSSYAQLSANVQNNCNTSYSSLSNVSSRKRPQSASLRKSKKYSNLYSNDGHDLLHNTKNNSQRNSKRQNELIEHLKLESKKWKSKYYILLKDNNAIEERYSRNSMQSEEWKGKYKSSELNLNHLKKKFENEMRVMAMSHQREISRVSLVNESRVAELQNKVDQQNGYISDLTKVKNELSSNLEELNNKYCESKTKQSSLENELTSSIKKSLEIQESLSQRLCKAQAEFNENDTKYHSEQDRVKSLLSVKESDVAFLRSQLKQERESFHAKLNDKTKGYQEQIEKLTTEISCTRKELQYLEKQKEEFSRSSIIATESLNKTLDEYANERRSITKLHCNENERKEKQIHELKEMLTRQQARINKLMDSKRHSDKKVNKAQSNMRNLKQDLNDKNQQCGRLTQELSFLTESEAMLKKKCEQYHTDITNLRAKNETIVNNLSSMTEQRDMMSNKYNKVKLEYSECEMKKNENLMRSQTSIEMNRALKSEMDDMRRTSVSLLKFTESKMKCNKLSSELKECYNKIERLSLHLDDTRMSINKLSAESVPISAYQNLVKNVSALESENMRLAESAMTAKTERNNLCLENNKLTQEIYDYESKQSELKHQSKECQKSLQKMAATNQEMCQQKNHLKKKYKKMKLNLDDLCQVTQINQNLHKTNKFLRTELSKFINQNPVSHCRECANPKCNKLKGLYLKIQPKTLNTLKKACNLSLT